MFAAILDTCVLWPSLQRDFILSMAAEGLYRPLWSEAILGELRRHEELKLLGRGVEAKDSQRRADYLIMKMRTNFDDALVTGWEPLEGSYGLRDPNDEHVVAAAVVGGAGGIVTDNFKHIQPEKVPAHIKVLHPAEFAADTADVDPLRAAYALHTLAGRLRNPPRTPAEILVLLESRYAMHDVAEILAPHV
ncbi:PIN domain-containing protein [Kocuria sp. SM24M-10]|uniref:PIN domain-containing protein n=1 Tax=Kocuria sp. SM24M-10 TaxID=1660349 RepID=UPI0009E2DCFF|nr:PIN domain-containing protein [Kocuria sp. SM24M-10]